MSLCATVWCVPGTVTIARAFCWVKADAICYPLSLKRKVFVLSIAPVALHPNPTLWSVHPTTRDPDRARARRRCPTAGNPDVRTAIPALISIAPGPARAGRWTMALIHRRRRSDANIDLRMCRADGQGRGKKCSHNQLSHGSFSCSSSTAARINTTEASKVALLFQSHEACDQATQPIIKASC